MPNSREMVTCPACHGRCRIWTGQTEADFRMIDCPECNGLGLIPGPCPKCDGKGRVFFFGLGQGSHIGPCPVCAPQS